MPEFRGWLAEGDSPSKAHCSCCNTSLTSGKSELLRHAKSKKHIRKVANFSASRVSTDHSELSDDMMDDIDPLGSPDVVSVCTSLYNYLYVWLQMLVDAGMIWILYVPHTYIYLYIYRYIYIYLYR